MRTSRALACLLLLLATSSAFAQVKINALPAGSAISGPNLTICDQSGVTNGCTFTQVLSFVQSGISVQCATLPALSGVITSSGCVTSFASVTGSGAVVLATSPTLVTPALGTPSAVVLTNGTGLPLAGLATQTTATVVANTSGSTAAPTAVALTAFQTAMILANANLVSDSPAAGPLNDYNPAGFGTTVAVLYLTPTAGGTTLNGLVAGSNMQQVFIINAQAAGGADLIKLVNQSASDPTAANRFLTSATTSLAIPAGGRVDCIYLAGSINRWSCQ